MIRSTETRCRNSLTWASPANRAGCANKISVGYQSALVVFIKVVDALKGWRRRDFWLSFSFHPPLPLSCPHVEPLIRDNMKSSLPCGILLPVKINRYAELLMPPISRSNKLQSFFFLFLERYIIKGCFF